jgi:hypothetical protein
MKPSKKIGAPMSRRVARNILKGRLGELMGAIEP